MNTAHVYSLEDYGLIEIYCDHKSHPYYIIAKMQKSPHGGPYLSNKWDQVEPMSNEFRREHKALARDMGEKALENPEAWDNEKYSAPSDKQWSFVYIKNGKPIPLDQAFLNDDSIYKKYEFKCPYCHKGRAPIERREEKLTPVFEALHTAHIDKVSWRKLARWISYYDNIQK